jgi:hypothetical protein
MSKSKTDEDVVTLTPKQKKELSTVFPYEYSGGGYFRKKHCDKGESAPILHGMQALEYLYSQIDILLLTNDE